MTAGLGLVVLALIGATLGPWALSGAAWTIDRPRTALATWWVGLGAVVIALGCGVTVVVTDAGPVGDPLRVASSPTHGVHLVVAAAAVAAFVLGVRVRPGAEHRAVRDAIRTAGSAHARHVDGTVVAFVEADHALACAVPGRGVLVSTGLRARLTEDELAAVVAHEAAHLRGRHAVFVTGAESVERTVPWLPGARAMARCTRVLVEFAADDAAVRRSGRATVIGAITAAGGGTALAGVRAERLLRGGGPTALLGEIDRRQ